MKRDLFILIIFSLITLSCSRQTATRKSNNKILLIGYTENSSCEVLEIDGKKVDPKKYSCGRIPGNIDVFTEYYPIKNVFYYDGILRLKSSDSILFWENFDLNSFDTVEVVDTLPFSCSKVKIRSIINDTTINLTLNKSKIIINPNEVRNDTIRYRKKEGNRLVKYVTILSIKNFGLLERQNILDNKNWKTKRVELGLYAPIRPEKLPQFEGGMNGLTKYFTKNIDTSLIKKTRANKKKIIVNFIIDKHGYVSTARIIKGINPTFDEQVIRVFARMPKWKPGMDKGKPIAVDMNIPIKFDIK